MFKFYIQKESTRSNLEDDLQTREFDAEGRTISSQATTINQWKGGKGLNQDSGSGKEEKETYPMDNSQEERSLVVETEERRM